MIEFSTVPTSTLLFQEISVEYQLVFNRTQQRMWGREIVKKSSVRGHNNSGCFDQFFCPADKAISLFPIETPLIGSLCPPISQGKAFYTRRDTLPCGYLLRQHGQFAAFACQSLLSPQC